LKSVVVFLKIFTCKYLYTQEIEKQMAVKHSKMTKYLNK